MDSETTGRGFRPSKVCLWWLIALLMLLVTLVAWYGSASPGMEVTFHNSSEQMVESIQLDFGSADTQSRIQAFRIPAGEERILLLNHQPGMGFNVQVNYRDGNKQTFCALHGDDQRRPVIYLQP